MNTVQDKLQQSYLKDRFQEKAWCYANINQITDTANHLIITCTISAIAYMNTPPSQQKPTPAISHTKLSNIHPRPNFI